MGLKTVGLDCWIVDDNDDDCASSAVLPSVSIGSVNFAKM